MKIYLVRHGLTRWNKSGRYAGWSDVPLSPEGEAQAEQLARFFSNLGPFTLYTSDLSRTVLTAEIIGRGRGVVPAVLPDFRELFFGEWEGKTYLELAKAYPVELDRWFAAPFAQAPSGGETAARLAERAWAGFQKVTAFTPPGGAAVVVSHGGPIRAILHRCMKLKPEEFWNIPVDNASISLVVKANHHFQVVFHNSCDHLV